MRAMIDDKRREALERLRPYVERARTFSGWAFPDVRVSLLEPGPPWDYEVLVREHGRNAESALDLGTGGGEFVASVRDDLPRRVVATEEWHVNAPIAYRRLSPLGADLVWCRSLHLPFQDEAFDLVIDRHEELDPAEIGRVLRSGGWFLTQQVGRENWRELSEFFPRRTDFGDHFVTYAAGLEAAGVALARREQHTYEVAYESLGDMVFMLLVAPWEVPGFDVEQDLDALLALEEAHSTEEGLVMTSGRYLLEGQKR
jgi:SAM-dependent methyltransferase